MRINRVGFMQKHVLPLFGYYPWKCGSCGLQWVDAGRGFHGDRFSECLRCGTHAREGADSKPARRPPTVPAPRTGAPALPGGGGRPAAAGRPVRRG